MKKRVLALFLCLISLLTAFPVSARAEAAPLQILQQPESRSVNMGDSVSTTVVAAGDGLTYQWYYRNAGSSKFTKSSTTSDTYTTTMTKERDGRKVYCVIKDAAGNSVTSDTVTLSAIKPKITQQPESCSVKMGDTASATVVATGNGLSYQWYYRNANSSKFKKSTTTTPTYATTMTKERDGRKIYCVIKDAAGNSVTSDTVTLSAIKPKITQQPESCSVTAGDPVSVTVVATGDGLTYQWYYRNAGSSQFQKSSTTTDTYTTTMTKARDGRKVYCLVTDAYGASVKSDTVTLSAIKPQITQQPEGCSVKVGETASATVVASGNGLTYQWYYRNAGSSKFTKSSITSDTYTTTMTKARDGRKVYCIVTDQAGFTVKSTTVTLNAIKPQITQQPESRYVHEGEEVFLTVAATGDGLTYQWYYRNAGSSKFSKSSITTNTYATTMTKARDGRKVYCVVTDQHGFSVTSNTATLNIPEYAQITKQPKDTKIALGTTGSCSLSAKGDGLTYQWYFSDDDGQSFQLSDITKSAYSITMDAEKSGQLIYCVVSDLHGTSVQSNTVKLVAQGSFKVVTYEVELNATKDMAAELNFTTDDTLIWESSDDSVVSVTETGVITRHAKGTVTLTVTGEKTGITANCKIKAPGGKQVALTFDDGPSTHTARLLDYLETTDAKVTFFMVGNRMNSYKNTVKRMAAQGHELGYHSWDHYDQTARSSSQITSEYQKANGILKNLTGQRFTVWRTPGGSFNSRVLNAVPLPHIFWTSSTEDWRTRDAEKVYNAILKQAKDGSIILLHDLHGTTVDGAIRAMKKLEKEGYEFVTVTELLSRDGTPPVASKNYSRG